MNKRTSRIDVRLTQKERIALQKLANKQGVSMSDWFRSKIDEESEPKSNPLDVHSPGCTTPPTRYEWARWFDIK